MHGISEASMAPPDLALAFAAEPVASSPSPSSTSGDRTSLYFHHQPTAIPSTLFGYFVKQTSTAEYNSYSPTTEHPQPLHIPSISRPSIQPPRQHQLLSTSSSSPMSNFFNRKREHQSMIPPVAAPPPSANGGGGGIGAGKEDPYASNRQQLLSGPKKSAADPYASAQPGRAPPSGDPYASSASSRGPPSYRSTPGDPYGDAAAETNRNELLGGYKPTGKPQEQRKYGQEGRELEDDFDEEEEIEGIKQEMRGLKQESLASTRNALRIAREAEDTARGTVAKLADQSERIANTERHLDIAKSHNQRAEDQASELNKLNRSIFRPAVTWNKDAKLAAQERKMNERHLAEREEREKTRQDMLSTHSRLGKAMGDGPTVASADLPRPGASLAKKTARERYQFEATESDDELEDELDENLNETLDITKRLKALATAAGEEIDNHNKRLVGVTDKTETLDYAIARNTDKLKRAARMK